ncbi:MAG TPA: long-chain-acyl-CoA synthetase [Terracidiphilus sp.]|nr:long-chain-acyl-CoA synthetase [Terracidiphilus sp.]
MSDVSATVSRPASNPSRAWLRALERTAAIQRNPQRTIGAVIEEVSSRLAEEPALLSDRECFTFGELAGRTNQYTRWALEQGIGKGDVVGLLMTNRPEYFALWVGITAAGGVVALLNTHLAGQSLAHCVNVAQPKHLIVSREFVAAAETIQPLLSGDPAIWIYGADHTSFRPIDSLLRELPSHSLSDAERPALSIDDLALYIYTSGTTGLPKAAKVTHARVLQWAYWFAGMIDVQQQDRMYNCLPMYHSVGGVLATGAALVAGASVVVRESFSVSQFWSDVVRWDCTMFQYIGEFCRYLLHSAASPHELNHRIRVACGNGMSPDVWQSFQSRFQIPQILEFYASTEGGLSLFNAEGKPGAIGRIPPYLAHRFSPTLVKIDPETGEPVRNEQGFCVPCEANEPGEALARVGDRSQVGGRFEGYTDPHATERKLLRNAIVSGDTWVRTGDLMRRDEQGFYYFVDRVGDTFRWKGENVATTEVADALSSFPGIKHAIVYGVKVTGAEGRIGMASLTIEGDPDLSALRKHLVGVLPAYARPAFLRLQSSFETTGTFKYSKANLVNQGYNPDLTSDALYFDNPETQVFHLLDRTLYERIQAGDFRL